MCSRLYVCVAGPFYISDTHDHIHLGMLISWGTRCYAKGIDT